MGRLIVYCDTCGERIVEEEIAKGKAMQDGGRYFCVKCKPASPPKTPAVTPAVTGGVRPATQSIPKVSTSRHAARATQSSKTPMIVAGVVAAVGLVLLLILVVGSGGGGGRTDADPATTERPKDAPKKAGVPDTTKVNTGEAEAAERKIVDEVELWVAKNLVDPSGVVLRCTQALAKVKVPALQQRLTDLKVKAEDTLKAADAEKKVDAILATAKSTASKDDEFLRKAEVDALFDQAREAGAGQGKLIDRIVDAERGYREEFDAAAKKTWLRIYETAEQLSFEKNNHKGALAHLEKFPLHFRLGEWRQKYDDAKAKYEEKIAQGELKIERGIWEDYEHATDLLVREEKYEEGAKILMDVCRRCNDRDRLQKEQITEAQLQAIATNGQYNIACYWSRSMKDVKQACYWLEAAIKCGYRDWTHLDTDKDFDNVRGSDEFKTLLRRYKRMFGVESLAIDDEESKKLGLPPGQGGVRIKKVVEGSVAEKAGVKVDDLIIEFDKKTLPVENTQEKFREFIAGTKDGADVPLVVLRDKKKVALKAKWPK